MRKRHLRILTPHVSHTVLLTAQADLLAADVRFADPASADRRQLREKFSDDDVLLIGCGTGGGGNPPASHLEHG